MARPSGRQLLPVFVALVAIVAIALAAATVTETERPGLGGPGQGGTGFGGGLGRGAGPGGGDAGTTPPISGNISNPPQTGQAIPLTMCIRFLQTPLGILSILVGYGVFLYLMLRRYNAARVSMTGYVTAPVLFIAYFMLTRCPTLPSYRKGNFGSLVNSTTGGAPTVPVPPIVLVALFGVIFVGGVALLFLATDSDELVEPEETGPDEAELDEQAFAEAAGRAADRIRESDAAVDNAVYEAWVEMTDLLEMPDPETSTPGDFAERAIEAGLNEADVNELTLLFNEVRYGHKDPAEREDRAVQTLRNIEEQYGADTGGTDATDAGTTDGDAVDDTDDSTEDDE